MKKINFKELGTKAAGLAVGNAAAGFLVKQSANLKITDPIMQGGLLIIAGAFVPNMAKGKLMSYVGDGMIVKGVDTIMRKLAPNMIGTTEGTTENFIAENVSDYVGDYASDDIVENFEEDNAVNGIDYAAV